MALSQVGLERLNTATTDKLGERKNLIINGAMTVSQRGTSFASTHNTYSLDRFLLEKENNAANFTITQSTTSPDGFSKSLKVDCTTADTSTASNEFVTFRYKIEAQDLQQLGYGTSGAKPLVLSFYVRSNVTGTYAVNCLQRDNSSKLYTRNYTIDSADTWERKTISIPADTSGVINDDNGSGLEIYIPLVMGSTYTSGSQSTTAWETFANSKFAAGHAVNVLSNTSNEWYLTGVQLEVGSVVTDFEHRSFGDELLKCQRYYYRTGLNQAVYYGGDIAFGFTDNDNDNCNLRTEFPVQMRIAPTAVEQTGTGSDYKVRVTTTQTCDNVPVFASATAWSAKTSFRKGSHGFGTAVPMYGQTSNSNSFLAWSAEL